MNKIICVTGLCGAGKSVVSDYFVKKGYLYVRFGQLVMDEITKRGLEVNEDNEKKIRMELRQNHGMAAFAILNLPKFEELLTKGNVIADGLYSFEEYKVLIDHFGEQMAVVAIFVPPKMRYDRLGSRIERGLTPQEARSRDYNEIENLNKGGTIAMADFTVNNTKNVDYLFNQLDEIVTQIASR